MPNQRTIIQKDQRVNDDNQYIVSDAVLVRFMNKGQSIVWIDEQETLEPGEAFTETSPIRINHEYRINFLPNPSPPAQNIPFVYSGNNLKIRVLKLIE